MVKVFIIRLVEHKLSLYSNTAVKNYQCDKGCLPCQGNVREMSGTCQGNPFLYKNVRGIWSILAMSGKSNFVHKSSLSPLCHYLFYGIYMVERQRSTRSIMNLLFVLIAKRAFFAVIEGVESKNFKTPFLLHE